MADATPEAAPEAPRAPAKKSKLLVIIIAAVVVLGAAGGGAYFFLGKNDAAAATADAAGKSDDKSNGKGKGKAKEPKAPAVYVKFDPPFVVNFEAKGMMRFLQVSVEVMTRDPATAELIRQHDPMLRNDLLMLLGNQSYEAISTRAGKEYLRGEALQTVARIVTAEGGSAKSVEQLYFTSFVMQ